MDSLPCSPFQTKNRLTAKRNLSFLNVHVRNLIRLVRARSGHVRGVRVLVFEFTSQSFDF